MTRPAAISSVLLVTAIYGSPSAQPCRIEGQGAVSRLDVDTSNGTGIALALTDHEVGVTPKDGSRVNVESRSGLAFEGSASLQHLSFALSSTFSLGDGAIRVAPSSPLTITALETTGATALIPLGSGVSLGPATVPCDLLLVGTPSATATAIATTRPSDTTFHITPGVLYIRSDPDRQENIRVITEGLHLPIVETRGGWLHVRGTLPHGVIDGWTHVPHIRPQARRSGGRGSAGCFGTSRPTEPAVAATLRSGGTLHLGRNGPAWATARRDIPLSEVIIRVGDEWAQVFRIASISDAGRDYLSNAWVCRMSLR